MSYLGLNQNLAQESMAMSDECDMSNLESELLNFLRYGDEDMDNDPPEDHGQLDIDREGMEYLAKKIANWLEKNWRLK